MIGDNKPKYDIGIKNAQGMAIGDNITQYLTFHESSEQLSEESLEDVQHERFKPPSHGDRLKQIITRHKVLLICGPNRMGKATLARFVAASLMQATTSPRKVYRLRRRSGLMDMLDFLDTQQETIVLGYDLEPTDVQDAIDEIYETAIRGTNFVVLTTNNLTIESINSPELKSCAVAVRVGFPYTLQDLEALLISELGSRTQILGQRQISTRKLAQKLASPSKIVRFVDMLPGDGSLPRPNEWTELLNTINDEGLEVRLWLGKLEKNERYFILMMALFDDLPERAFWAMYDEFIGILRDRDPTLLLLDYYALDACQGLVLQKPRIRLKEAEVRETVINHLLPRYRRGLIALLPYLEKRVIKEGLRRANAGIRITAAEAVGFIGTVEWEETKAVLYRWASEPRDHINAATGHAFRQMVEMLEDEALAFILPEIDDWLKANAPTKEGKDTEASQKVRWTVAASLGRIGQLVSADYVQTAILPRLDDLSRDSYHRVRSAAINSLRMIGSLRFNQVRRILTVRAKQEWREQVQLEVASTLAYLSLRRWRDVRNLLQEWLNSGDKELLWTGFCALLLIEDKKVSAKAKELTIQIAQNPLLRTGIETRIKRTLQETELNDDKAINLLSRLAEEDEPIMLRGMLISALVYALYHDASLAVKLINSWEATSSPKYIQLAQTTRQQLHNLQRSIQRERELLLTKHLTDDDMLSAFAAKLPSAQRAAFWQEVDKRRTNRRRKQMALVVGIVLIVLMLVATLFFSLG